MQTHECVPPEVDRNKPRCSHAGPLGARRKDVQQLARCVIRSEHRGCSQDVLRDIAMTGTYQDSPVIRFFRFFITGFSWHNKYRHRRLANEAVGYTSQIEL